MRSERGSSATSLLHRTGLEPFSEDVALPGAASGPPLAAVLLTSPVSPARESQWRRGGMAWVDGHGGSGGRQAALR